MTVVAPLMAPAAEGTDEGDWTVTVYEAWSTEPFEELVKRTVIVCVPALVKLIVAWLVVPPAVTVPPVTVQL